MSHPIIIQGGMGAGVSNWRLARAVSQLGQMGVVSGTALDVILARRLQEGDPEGEMRRAFARFPIPGMAQRALDRYFVPGGKSADQSYKPIPYPPRRRSNSSCWPTLRRSSWPRKATAVWLASIICKRSSSPRCPRSLARCWPVWTMY